MVTCPFFNLTKEENRVFKPLKGAHKRQGADWGKAYQALKHDRYSSINQGTVKKWLHAMGALYLLNIYYKNVSFTSKFLEINEIDFSLGSSIFSVKQPSYEYIMSSVNNQETTDLLGADESPFILKYTDSHYRQVLDANKTMQEEMYRYWSSQPELKEPEFIQQIIQAQEKEKNDPQKRCIPLWELAQYRLRKKIPISLPFEERKRLLIASPEWNGPILQRASRLKADEITEANIQAEIDKAGMYAGMELQQRFENIRINKAFREGYCELVLDTGNVRYNK